jgi:hypothetical protein
MQACEIVARRITTWRRQLAIDFALRSLPEFRARMAS